MRLALTAKGQLRESPHVWMEELGEATFFSFTFAGCRKLV
jgi:hypothetical protein